MARGRARDGFWARLTGGPGPVGVSARGRRREG
nr:MAG TPA: hypothetical protein [Caudoviricetes sp.]